MVTTMFLGCPWNSIRNKKENFTTRRNKPTEVKNACAILSNNQLILISVQEKQILQPEANSGKKRQVYFTSQTLVFTNSHQFKFTKSLYKFLLQASNHLTTTCRPPTNHLPTTYQPPTDHLLTTWPTDHLPTTYQPTTDHFLTVQLVPYYLVLTMVIYGSQWKSKFHMHPCDRVHL